MEAFLARRLRQLLRGAFVLCLAGVLFFALGPQLAPVSHVENDKTQHVLAFLVLAGLGVLGWRSSAALIGVGLLLFGGVIEILQGTHFVGRDMSSLDWLADAAGILGGMSLAAIAMRVSPLLARSSA